MKSSALGFSFYLLERALEKRKRALECLRLDTIKRVEEALEKASLGIPFQEAYLFGSVTKPGHFREDSDIDIGFYGLKDEDFFRMMSFLSEELRRDVEVVQLEGHRLEDRVRKEGMRWTRRDSPF